MKLINHLATLVLIAVTSAACSKKDAPDPDPVSGWVGQWVNKENSQDILVIERETIKRSDLKDGKFNHKYDYTVNGDSISLAYNGTYYLYTPEMKFHFIFNTEINQIEIKDIHTYFPMYKGDIFIKKEGQ